MRGYGAQGAGLLRMDALVRGNVECLRDFRVAVLESLLLQDGGTAAAQRVEDLLCGEIEDMLRSMQGMPLMARLLDNPIARLLPSGEDAEVVAELAAEMELEPVSVRGALLQLQSPQPMLAVRGCRLANEFPYIFYAQVRPC